jgi:hypothetical protein
MQNALEHVSPGPHCRVSLTGRSSRGSLPRERLAVWFDARGPRSVELLVKAPEAEDVSVYVSLSRA